MENIVYKDWNITNAYNDQGVEYWTIWTPEMLDMVAEDFSFIKSCINEPDKIEVGTCWIGDKDTYEEIINNL